eukprot:gene9841-6913_t
MVQAALLCSGAAAGTQHALGRLPCGALPPRRNARLVAWRAALSTRSSTTQMWSRFTPLATPCRHFFCAPTSLCLHKRKDLEATAESSTLAVRATGAVPRSGGPGTSAAAGRGGAGAARRSPPHGSSSTAASSSASSSVGFKGTPGKRKRDAGSAIKVRPRAPWGIRQLRDSWSQDAMTSRETENMSERMHRENRYHPDEFRRYHIKYAALLVFPCIIFGTFVGYYYHTGRPLWEGNPQELLNYIRRLDTSPRSALYADRIEGQDKLPDHIVRYRAEHYTEREAQERVFQLIHTVCRNPTEEELRQLEAMDREAAEAAAAAAKRSINDGQEGEEGDE